MGIDCEIIHKDPAFLKGILGSLAKARPDMVDIGTEALSHICIAFDLVSALSLTRREIYKMIDRFTLTDLSTYYDRERPHNICTTEDIGCMLETMDRLKDEGEFEGEDEDKAGKVRTFLNWLLSNSLELYIW